MRIIFTLLVLTSTSMSLMAAPGSVSTCGMISRMAAQAQKFRQSDLPNYSDSDVYVTSQVNGYVEFLKEKDPNIAKEKLDYHIYSYRQKATFVAKMVYQSSSKRDPKDVAEYANSMCLIDID